MLSIVQDGKHVLLFWLGEGLDLAMKASDIANIALMDEPYGDDLTCSPISG
jgi:hypothetical protein